MMPNAANRSQRLQPPRKETGPIKKLLVMLDPICSQSPGGGNHRAGHLRVAEPNQRECAGKVTNQAKVFQVVERDIYVARGDGL